MSQNRTITVDYGLKAEVVYVVGTQLTVNLYRTAPPSAKFVLVNWSNNVRCEWPGRGKNLPLEKNSVLKLSMSTASKEQGDGKVNITLYDQTKVLKSAELLLTAVEISLDVDADQDGKVEKNNPNKASWEWGLNGHGAILLVNCDSDTGKRPDTEERAVYVPEDLKDMSPMFLRTAGPKQLPEGHRLKLWMSHDNAKVARVFRKVGGGDNPYPLVLDSETLSREIEYTKEITFYVMGVKFADKDFDGLVKIHVNLMQQGNPETRVFVDTVQFRMAPWIMTPNVQTPLKVFVCRTSDNKLFLDGMTDLVKKALKQQPHIVDQKYSLGDRWIQDEIEFGYIQAPHQSFPVVLESPRDRELAGFAYNELLGPDFGYWTVKPPKAEVTSLESFGNLEVSPPVTVNGKRYPMGRIIIGESFITQTYGRHVTSAVKDFLLAQIVQAPFAIFSDWLDVGHIDEFLSFVPAKDRREFRLLLASPAAAYKLCQGLQEAGHGQATFFEGKPDMEVTVNDVLADKDLFNNNDYYQRCIDWNRDCLKNCLGLDEEDIVDIPVLYKPAWNGAHSFYPNVVNMIVLGQNLGIAKPFGPKVNGQCAIEREVTRLLGDLGFICHFIDDFVYYTKSGDVHCGSNVRRKAFDFKWWEMEKVSEHEIEYLGASPSSYSH